VSWEGRARATGAALLVATLGAACSTARPGFSPVSPEAAAAARERLSEACRKAWTPRRLKALFAVEVSPAVGAIQRGFLTLFWDGRRLLWRTSLPMAGQVGEGALERGATSPGGLAAALSPNLKDSDALSVLLGAPECPTAAPAVEGDRSSYRILLEGKGRDVVLGPSGRVTEMGFPGGVEVRLWPGEEVPTRIELKSRKGRALLKLEAAGDWPAQEPAPSGGR
jgi:hypothetical protein